MFSTERKTRIIADLQAGKPTMIRINTHMADSGTQAFHALAVIGYHRECEEDGHNCDNCDKFTIVDSGIPGTDGAVLCLAFEDLFTKVDAENTTDGSQNCIMLVSFPEQEEQQAE